MYINDSERDLTRDILLGLAAQPAEMEDHIIVEDLLGNFTTVTCQSPAWLLFHFYLFLIFQFFVNMSILSHTSIVS